MAGVASADPGRASAVLATFNAAALAACYLLCRCYTMSGLLPQVMLSLALLSVPTYSVLLLLKMSYG